jgi:hypothetical protein
VEVAAAGVVALKDEMVRFDPHLVVCSRPNAVDPNGRPAWFELPPDPSRLAVICLDGQRLEVANPALEKLLSVVDETERPINTKPNLGNC